MVESVTEKLKGKEFPSDIEIGTGTCAAPFQITNSQLVEAGIKRYSGEPMDEEFIVQLTGIRQRPNTQPLNSPNANPNEWIPKMGAWALQEALKSTNQEIDDLDYLLVSISFPLSTPASESVYQTYYDYQKPLDPEHAPKLMDGHGACAGFVEFFHYMDKHKETFAHKKIGLVASEQNSIHAQGGDKTIFADSAGAFVGTLDKDFEILGSHSEFVKDDSLKMRTQKPSKYQYATVAFSINDDIQCPNDNEPDIVMEGHRVFEIAVGPKSVAVANQACENAGLELKDIDIILIHQANERITKSIDKTLRKKYGFDGKMPSNIEYHGNTSSASIPILLDELKKSGEIKKGQNVLLWGIGAGMLISAAVIRFI